MAQADVERARTGNMTDGDLSAIAIESMSQLPPWILSEVSERIAGFNASPANSISDEDVAQLVDRLTYVYFMLPVLLPHRSVLYRGRPCGPGETYSAATELHYPPSSDKVSQARANVQGQAVLYCASTHETVFAELRLSKGNHMNLAEVEVVSEHGCLYTIVGDIDHIRRFGRSHLGIAAYEETISKILYSIDGKTAMAVRLVDAFFRDRFSRKGDQDEYRITAHIANELMTAQELDAIAFASVEHPGGLNWAFRKEAADKKLRYRSFSAIRILEAYGYGMYEGGVYARAAGHAADGTVAWEFPK